MKRYQFSQYDGVDLFAHAPAPIELPETDDKSEKNVLTLVYPPDPLTGRPRSDLGTYFSENTNPLVREYIERQLRTDFSGVSVKVPEGISDQDLTALTRDVHETVDDYSKRVNKYMLRQKFAYQSAVRESLKKVEPKE